MHMQKRETEPRQEKYLGFIPKKGAKRFAIGAAGVAIILAAL